MTGPAQTAVQNLLLASLTRSDFDAFAPHLDRVTLADGETVARSDGMIDSVYFPESAVMSIVAGAGINRIEVGIVGAEGMSGLPTLFGCDRSPHDEIVHMRPGSALRISRARFVPALQLCPSAKAVFLRAALAFSIQMGRTLVANIKYPIERRLARWLLMRHDRLGGDGIELTHRYIGAMLGVRRATITDTMHVLEGKGAVRNVPGWIFIRDRDALERIAGTAYSQPERDHRQMIGATPAHWRPAAPMELPVQA